MASDIVTSFQDQELSLLKAEAQQLRDKLEEARASVCDTTFTAATASLKPGPMIQLQKRRTLRGHFGKIVGLHWGPAPHSNFVCASQSCQLIVWNPISSNMEKVIKLDSTFVLCCAFSPSGELVASGGMDYCCNIYDLAKEPRYNSAPATQLQGHGGFISFIRFLEDTRLLTASGDGTCALWDVQANTKAPIAWFRGHAGSVTSLSPCPIDSNVFVSGGCDFDAKLWDLRMPVCVQTFAGHQADVNAVKFFPTGQSFVTGSDDTTCLLFDIRSDQKLQNYGTVPEDLNTKASRFAVSSLDISLSGRLIIPGFDSGHFLLWDTLKATRCCTPIKAHENRVSTLGVSPDGKMFATGSYDCTLKLWN